MIPQKGTVAFGYAGGVTDKQAARFGGTIGENAAAWNSIGTNLPEPEAHDIGASVAVDFSLEKHEIMTLYFILAHYAPLWKSTSENTYMNMYATRFEDALEVAEYLARRHRSLLARVLA